MKLKEAISKVKEINKTTEYEYKWIAVSCDGRIYAYDKKPFVSLRHTTWRRDYWRQLYLGYYTGNKHWSETRRKVR